MYVRVKRHKQTFFLHVEPSETILEVKQKVQQLTDQPADEQRLFHEGVNLDDAKSLAELKVENDTILALTFKLDGISRKCTRKLGNNCLYLSVCSLV